MALRELLEAPRSLAYEPSSGPDQPAQVALRGGRRDLADTLPPGYRVRASGMAVNLPRIPWVCGARRRRHDVPRMNCLLLADPVDGDNVACHDAEPNSPGILAAFFRAAQHARPQRIAVAFTDSGRLRNLIRGRMGLGVVRRGLRALKRFRYGGLAFMLRR